MANYVFNIAKGRIAEFYNRVKSNDPANSALILIPLSVQGSEAEAQDYDTVTAVLGGTSDEQTGGGWVRKTLTDAQLAAFPAPNDTDNRYDIPVPSVTWTAPTAGSDTVGLLIAYDADTTSGTDTNLLPLSSHTFTVTADGNDVVLNVGDFVRSS
jgi:hypothetical protein